MACACKVSRDLSYLQSHYGIGGPKQKESDIRKRMLYKIREIGIMTLAIPLAIPFVIYTIGARIGGKKITIKELFRLNGGKQDTKDKGKRRVGQ